MPLGKEIVGYIARRNAGAGERWALHFPDGALSNSFSIQEDRAGVAKILAASGLTLRDDNQVVRA